MNKFLRALSGCFLVLGAISSAAIGDARFLSEEYYCDLVDVDTAYEYQQKALVYITNIDDIVNVAENASEWYYTMIAPYQSSGVKWMVDAGPRVFSVNGTEAVGELFENFASRNFSFHQWSHWTACEGNNDDVNVLFRYHGVAREQDAMYQDIFGSVEVVFKTKGSRQGLITEVAAVRTGTIDRPY